jgi:hypothetical protein
MAIVMTEKFKINFSRTEDDPSETLLKKAAMVSKHVLELVAQVMSGILPLEDAYKQARRNKVARSKLKEKAPDLAEAVQPIGKLSKTLLWGWEGPIACSARPWSKRSRGFFLSQIARSDKLCDLFFCDHE